MEGKPRKSAGAPGSDQLLRWAFALLVMLLLAVVAFVIVSTLLAFQQLSGLPGQVMDALRPETTPTIRPVGITIVQDVQRLALIQSSRYNIEKVITAETGQDSPFAFLTGDRLLFVAVGYVTAGVDLSGVGEADLTVSEDGLVTVRMPAARLIDCFLDESESFVYSRATGLLANPVDLETHARRAALVEIREAALEAGILDHAQDQAQNVVRALVLGLGFRDAAFDVLPATPIPLTSETCFGAQLEPVSANPGALPSGTK